MQAGARGGGGHHQGQIASLELLSGTFTAAAAAFLLSRFVGFSLFFHLMTAFFPPLDNVPTVL